jgi:hypothetical protein
MSKIYDVVKWYSPSENNNWFVKSDEKYFYVLDSDFNIVVKDDSYGMNIINCVWNNKQIDIDFKWEPGKPSGMLIKCDLDQYNSIQNTFKTNLEKYNYQQINNYFCKIPKTISTYYQDTEKETYYHSYFLLQNLHDTRTIIFKFLLELKRVDYDGYKKIDI